MPTSRRTKGGANGDHSKRSHKAAPVSVVRRAAKRITRVDDLYGGGETGRLLEDEFVLNPKVNQLIQRRHRAVSHGIGPDGIYRSGDDEWKVPVGVRLCLKQPLIWGQIVNKYPWYVTWVSPKTGKRLKKYFNTALAGINFIATKAQYVDPRAALVSRQVGYDIPVKLRGKLPGKWRWCPYCMNARKFRPHPSGDTFYTERKEWSEEKQRYIWKERKLRVLYCPCCTMTNQDPKMRRSNQPWEVRRLKRGVQRVVRRK